MFAPKVVVPQAQETVEQPRIQEQDSVQDADQAPRISRDFSMVPVALQARLVVGAVDDPLEHQADRMADQVMGMAEPMPAIAAAGALVQRKCAACEEEEEAVTLRPKRQADSLSPDAVPGSVEAVLRSSGTALDASARAFFEPRFGRDFSQVRVHTDGRAASSAQSIGARAYTVGRHIAFAEGQYAPGSASGRHLLAHELTHTIQQGATRVQRQAVTGLVERPAETARDVPEEAEEVEEVTPAEEQVQRSTVWNGAVVHEARNLAGIALGTDDDPITWETLNGNLLQTDAIRDAAIRVPGIVTNPRPSTDPAATWSAQVDTVPAQEGGADETVLAAGPWTRVTTKVRAGAATGLARCSGAGNSTFSARGSPNDNAVFQANRRHEDQHVAHCRAAFNTHIVAWDNRVQAAQTAHTTFTGNSAANATANLWTAMGNTPQAASRAYSNAVGVAGGAFHGTARGGPMAMGSPAANADCSTSSVEVTNPS